MTSKKTKKEISGKDLFVKILCESTNVKEIDNILKFVFTKSQLDLLSKRIDVMRSRMNENSLAETRRKTGASITMIKCVDSVLKTLTKSSRSLIENKFGA